MTCCCPPYQFALLISQSDTSTSAVSFASSSSLPTSSASSSRASIAVPRTRGTTYCGLFDLRRAETVAACLDSPSSSRSCTSSRRPTSFTSRSQAPCASSSAPSVTRSIQPCSAWSGLERRRRTTLSGMCSGPSLRSSASISSMSHIEITSAPSKKTACLRGYGSDPKRFRDGIRTAQPVSRQSHCSQAYRITGISVRKPSSLERRHHTMLLSGDGQPSNTSSSTLVVRSTFSRKAGHASGTSPARRPSTSSAALFSNARMKASGLVRRRRVRFGKVSRKELNEARRACRTPCESVWMTRN